MEPPVARSDSVDTAVVIKESPRDANVAYSSPSFVLHEIMTRNLKIENSQPNLRSNISASGKGSAVPAKLSRRPIW